MQVEAARRRRLPRPDWQASDLRPYQGTWTEAEYFELEEARRCEFDDGYIEVLPAPLSQSPPDVRLPLWTVR